MGHQYGLLLPILFILTTSCQNKGTNSCPETFSPLIEYQYLFLNSNVEDGTYIDTYEIKYRSDGLMITGYISKPKNKENYPVIIYNRGGNRDFGTHSMTSLDNQRNIAAKGFVVLSTQLRGNMYSQGQDEFGGKDLNDILQLIKIAKSLTFVGPKKIGVYGVSRGGLNTYQISRLTDDIEAIAVVGAPVNPRLSHDYRPEMYHRVHLPLIGDTLKYKVQYNYRSPILWADEINEPTLILHGSADERVRVERSAELMVAKFNDLKKSDFEYKIFDNGNHGLSNYSTERDNLIVDWFSKYLK